MYEIIWEDLVLVVIFLEVLVVESCDTDMYLLDIYIYIYIYINIEGFRVVGVYYK